MRVAISTKAPNLQADVDPRFGRCCHLLSIDINSMEFESLGNIGPDASDGTGISAAQLVVDRKLGVVIAGEVGPKAQKVLAGAGVQVYTGVSGRVSDAVASYRTVIFGESA